MAQDWWLKESVHLFECRNSNWGEKKNEHIFLPCIYLEPGKCFLPFTMRRCYFPVICPITINISKLQVVSFDHTGLYLFQHVVRHAQSHTVHTWGRNHENGKTYIQETHYRGKFLSDDSPCMKHVAISVFLNNWS